MALPNFFKDYFYGRSSQRDFTIDDLPQNRIQLFRDMLSVRKGSMVGLNLLYFLIWIPALLWTVLNLLMLFGPPSDADYFYLDRLIFSYLAVLCPLITITGPFNVGVSYVLRNWARDEHSFVLSHFASAMKANWKQGLLLGFISGLMPLVTFGCAYVYGQMARTSWFYFLPIAITLIIALIWNLCAMILPMMIVTYRQSFFTLVRNALLMIIVALPRTMLIRLSTWALPLLLTILAALDFTSIFAIAAGITLLLYLVFMLAFNKLIHASFANALCETYLNTQIDGAQTGIGLRPKKENEEHTCD